MRLASSSLLIDVRNRKGGLCMFLQKATGASACIDTILSLYSGN